MQMCVFLGHKYNTGSGLPKYANVSFPSSILQCTVLYYVHIRGYIGKIDPTIKSIGKTIMCIYKESMYVQENNFKMCTSQQQIVQVNKTHIGNIINSKSEDMAYNQIRNGAAKPL